MQTAHSLVAERKCTHVKRSRFRASEGASGTEQERGPQAVRLPSQTWGVSLDGGRCRDGGGEGRRRR